MTRWIPPRLCIIKYKYSQFPLMNVDNITLIYYTMLIHSKILGIEVRQMWLSTKSKYGLRAIYEVGISYGKGPVALSFISEKYGISQAYLEQIFSILKKSQLIISKRGQAGGYFLSRPPAEITIGEVLRCLEGSFTPSECESENIFCCNECITGTVFRKINEGINSVIDNFTLQDLIDEKNEGSDLNEEGVPGLLGDNSCKARSI